MGVDSSQPLPDGIEPNPLYPHGKRPLPSYLARYAAEQPDAPSIEYYGRELSFSTVDAAADSFAAALAARGYEPGDTIIISLHNVPQFSLALVGAQRAGVVPATPMPDADPDRLQHYVERTSAKGLLIHDTNASTAKTVRERTGLQDVFFVRYETYLPERSSIDIPEHVRSATDEPLHQDAADTRYLRDLLTTGASPPAVDLSLDDTALYMFTGGTTGVPKTVPFTFRDNLEGAARVGTVWESHTHDRHLLVYHMQRSLLFFSVLPQLVFGNTLVLLDRPDEETVMAAIETAEPHLAMFRSPLLKSILNHPDSDDYDLTSMERLACLSFQTQLTEEMAERWRAVTGSPAYEYTWGAVELHGVATFGNRIPVYEPGFVGVPVHDADIVVRDVDTGEPLPVGDVGEITVDHPAMCDSYLDAPEKTADAFRDGYFYTDDLGRRTENGHLYYLGRTREMIRVDGEHVAPRAIERVVETHPAVDSAGVVGVPRAGDTEVACTVTLDDELTPNDLAAWLATRIEDRIRRPSTITIMEELPVSNLGKLDRDALQSRLA